MNLEYPQEILGNLKRKLYFDLGAKQFLASDRTTRTLVELFSREKLFKDTPYEKYHEAGRGQIPFKVEAIQKFYENQPEYVEEDHYNLAYAWGWTAAYHALYRDFYKVEEFEVKLKALLKEYSVDLEYESMTFTGGPIRYRANISLHEEDYL